jgi:hypothetical protein
MLYLLKQSQTARPLLFLLVSSTDHTTPATGKTPTVTLSKNGAAFASPAGAVSEVGSGWYQVAGNATDAGTLGPLLLHATATGADATDVFYEVVAFDPTDAAGLGLSRLDAAVSSRSTYAGGAVASVTGNVGGNVVGSVGSVVADVGITQAGADKVWTSAARTLTSFGTLVADVATAVWGAASRTLSAFGFGVTVTTNSDKTGYSLSAGEHTAIAADTQTGLTAQGVTGARAALLDNLDAAISSRLASAGYTAPPDLTSIIDGVLDELLSSHTTVGSVGAGIAAAGGAGDPWATALPSTYTSGQAGYILAHNLDVPVSTRAGADARITTTGPVLTGGRVVLIRGDAYQAERGTALVWTYAGPVDVGSAAAVAFRTPGAAVPLVLPVTVAGSAGAWTLTAGDLTAAASAALGDDLTYYTLEAAWADPDTDRVTLARGPLQVTD